MDPAFDPRYPSIDDLRARARRRIPRFAFEYLDGGCNEDVNLDRNRADLQRIALADGGAAALGAIASDRIDLQQSRLGDNQQVAIEEHHVAAVLQRRADTGHSVRHDVAIAVGRVDHKDGRVE